MGKRKGPETKVRSRVRNHTKDKLNGLNGLVDNNLAKAVFFVIVFTTVLFFVLVVVLNGLMVRRERK
jgi:hypothetical protein